MSAGVSTDDVSDASSRHQPISLGTVKVLQLEVKESWGHLHVGTNPAHHDMYNLLWSKITIITLYVYTPYRILHTACIKN